MYAKGNMNKPRDNKPQRDSDHFVKSIIHRTVYLDVCSVGSNVTEMLESQLRPMLENKCTSDGYIREGSCKLVSYSNGQVTNGNCKFKCIIECSIFRVENDEMIECKVKSVIDSTGLVCEIPGAVVYVSRDHMTSAITNKEGDTIRVRVVGVKYELDDPHVSIIGLLSN
jgi:DNA-directed RNA polymerase subunit E'/Rpb7